MRARLHGVHPFLDSPGPVGIAHRGGAGEAPENTLEAFAAAVALGYRYLETDAHVSRDGVVVAFHDPRLDDRTDRTGAIAALSIAEIEAADAGHVFSPDAGRSFPFRGRGVRIPRLEELLLRWPEARVNIDPKADACVEPLVAVIERLGAWDRVGIGSFSDRRLRRVRALSRGRACTSMGPRAVAGARAAALCGRMPRQGADCVQVPLHAGPIPIVTAGFVRAAHRAGLPVHVWTVNAESSMHDLLDLGVDGIMTDRPRLLRDVFAARDLAVTGERTRAGAPSTPPADRQSRQPPRGASRRRTR
jgi:glycerophosphoryl diester phosphodiesterase